MPLYVARLKKNSPAAQEGEPPTKPRLIQASHPSKVQGLLLQDFEIERVDAKEAHRLGVELGVKIEDA